MSACCPETGPDISSRFTMERAAVEAEMSDRGQSVDMSGVSVYVSYHENCDGALGCCNTGMCGGIFVPDAPVQSVNRVCPLGTDNPGCWTTPEQVALHEYVHQALGPSSENHGPEFNSVLDAAQKRLTL